MVAEKSPNSPRTFFRLHVLASQLERESISLALIWLLRFGALLAITGYFGLNRAHYADALTAIRAVLLVFFAYVIVSGIGGVYYYEKLLSRRIKLIQATIEVLLYSLCYALTGDEHSTIYLLYFLPLFVAARYSRAYGSALILVITLIALFLALSATAGSRDTFMLLLLYFPKALMLVVVTLFFALRRSPTLLDEVQNAKLSVLSVLQAVDSGVFLVDQQWRLIFVNDTLCAKHGSYTRGQSYVDYFKCSNSLDPDALGPESDSAGITRWRQTDTFTDRDDHRYHVAIVVCAFSDDSGCPEGAIVFVRDLSSQQDLSQQIGDAAKSYLESQRQALGNAWNRVAQTSAELGRKLIAATGSDELMRFVVEETRFRLNAESAALFLLERGRLVRKAIVGVVSEQFAESYAIGEGITGRAIVSRDGKLDGHPQRINDVDRNTLTVPQHLDTYRTALASHQVKHLIAVPLTGREGSLGVLRVINRLESSGKISAMGFTQEDEDFLMTIGSMVASTVDNTRQLTEARQKLQEMTTLYTISQRLATPHLDELLQVIVDEAIKNIPNECKSVIQVIDDHTGRLISQATSRHAGEPSGSRPLTQDQGIAGRAIRQKSLQYVDDTSQDPDFIPRATHIGSLVVAPLIIGDRAIGTLSVDSRRPRAFTPENRRLLSMLAAHAAIAINNARLYEETKQLYAASATVNASLNRGEVLQHILDQLNRVVAYDSASVQLLDRRTQRLYIIECRGFDDPQAVKAITFPIDDPKFPNYEVIAHKKPYIVTDAHHQYPHFVREGHIYQSGQIRSMLGIPLVHRDEIIGMISLDKTTPGYFTDEDATMALAFANNAAIAITNAELYHKMQEQANENDQFRREAEAQARKWERLVEAGHKLIHVSSMTELYNFCVSAGAEIFDVEDCSIYLKNEEHHTIDLIASSNIPPDLWTKRTSISEPGLTAYVARSGEVLNFGGEAYKQHPAWAGKYDTPYVAHLPHLTSGYCHSLLLGPLVDSKGTTVGVLKLENRRGRGAGKAFSPFEVALHTAFATQIGMASEARRRSRESLGDELHDMMNFVQSTLVQRAAYTKALIARNQTPNAVAEIEYLTQAARNVYESLRRINDDIRDPILEEKGLIPALQHYAELLHISEQVHFDSRGTAPLTADTQYALYKIAQEALHNARKHANLGADGSIQVKLYKTTQSFELCVIDNGKGFLLDVSLDETLGDAQKFGLRSMDRWTKMIGAELEIVSVVGNGTCVRVTGQLQEVFNGRSN